MENRTVFAIHGARGTAPAPGPAFRRTGGHTSCFSLRTPRGLILVDAGTGLIPLGRRLARLPVLPPMTLLFTHFHLDHVMGLPLFQPLYRRDAEITIRADRRRAESWADALRAFAAPPFWPVPLERMGARIRFRPLPERPARLSLYGADVRWHPLRHPQQCLAYRLECDLGAVVIATDHEPGKADLDRRLASFCRDADWLVADAQYTESERAARRGWGHGTWRACARLAADAGARRLLLTHHDPTRTDSQVDALVRRAQRLFPATAAARDGFTWAR